MSKPKQKPTDVELKTETIDVTPIPPVEEITEKFEVTDEGAKIIDLESNAEETEVEPEPELQATPEPAPIEPEPSPAEPTPEPEVVPVIIVTEAPLHRIGGGGLAFEHPITP